MCVKEKGGHMALLAYSLGQGFVPARHRPALRDSGEFPNSREVILPKRSRDGAIPPGRGGTRKRAGMMPGPGRTMGPEKDKGINLVVSVHRFRVQRSGLGTRTKLKTRSPRKNCWFCHIIANAPPIFRWE